MGEPAIVRARSTAQAMSDALEEVDFRLDVQGRVVPGVVWKPVGASAPVPLLLAGHGGGFGFGGSRRADSVVALAEALGRDYGVATGAIDQPGCGDRPG